MFHNLRDRHLGPEAPAQTFEEDVRQFHRQILDQKNNPAWPARLSARSSQLSKPLLREAARESLQAQVDACSPHCPICGAPLQNVERRERTILTLRG